MAQATARHILVDSEAKCEELKSAIEGGQDFAEVARQHSNCPSGRSGGDLGSFGPGQMVPEFDKVVFSGEVNKVLGPVKTQFGYLLLEVAVFCRRPRVERRPSYQIRLESRAPCFLCVTCTDRSALALPVRLEALDYGFQRRSSDGCRH